tara:strand:+ start:23 stop:676 length:654 start_codon:yes stop_codon:yes gene_type:complete
MKVEILVPDKLSEITLGQYQKFVKLNTEENKDTPFLLEKMVEIFCSLNLQDILKIKFTSVQQIANKLNKLFEEEPEHIKTFSLNGVNYGFIPNLDDMTLGEYIDLDSNLSDWEKIHIAMAVLYRPIKIKKNNKYNIEEYTGPNNAERMKDMPLNIAMGSMIFFYNLSNELLTTTLNFLVNEMEESMTLEQQQLLEQNGVGINQSMDLLKGMLPSSIK